MDAPHATDEAAADDAQGVGDIWDPELPGVIELPSGRRLRGLSRRQAGAADSGADLIVRLACGMPPVPTTEHDWIEWRDFRGPSDDDAAIRALKSAHRRAATKRVVVTCAGGVGRRGTALAAMYVLDGIEPDVAVTWVRRTYHRRAVEVPSQRRFLRRLAARL